MLPFAHSTSSFHIQAQCSQKHSRTLSINTVEPVQNTETSYLPLNMQPFTKIHAPQPWKRMLTTQIFYQETLRTTQKKTLRRKTLLIWR